MSQKLHNLAKGTRPYGGKLLMRLKPLLRMAELCLNADFLHESTMSYRLFLRDVLANPLQMGALAPSSRALARAIVNAADIRAQQTIVELGAGSGVFTREIVDRHPDSPLFAFEISPQLGAELRDRFTSATIVVAPVEALPQVASKIGLKKIDRIVSGLPWALWSETRQAGILDAIVPFLTPTARFVTFHYLHSRALGRVKATRRLLDARFTRVTHSRPVWANFPPAYIHIADGPRVPGKPSDDSDTRAREHRC